MINPLFDDDTLVKDKIGRFIGSEVLRVRRECLNCEKKDGYYIAAIRDVKKRAEFTHTKILVG